MTPLSRRLARLFQILIVSAVAILCAGWAVFNGVASRDEARLVGVVTRITEGDVFKPETLDALEPAMQRASDAFFPKPTLLRAVALIRLRQAETGIGSSTPQISSAALAAADRAVKRALAYMPADGFLWYARAWILKYQAGSSPSVLRALRLSYDTAAHEGWIAVRRNGFALSLFDDLPADLQPIAVKEYSALVASNYVRQAAGIICGPGWSQRERLLESLRSVPEAKRYDLYRSILDLGRDLPVPGVQRHPDRPWKSL